MHRLSCLILWLFFGVLWGQNTYVPGLSKARPETDVHFWHLELEPRMSDGYLQGFVETHLRALTSDSLLCFDLHDSLSVDSAMVNGTMVPFSRPGNGSVCLQPLQEIQAGSHYISGIWYQGFPPMGIGLGGYTHALRKGSPEVWTLSQPFAGHTWWPVKDALGDKADSVRLVIKTDSSYTSAAPGSLSLDSAGREVWIHRFPIPAYLVAFSVANYVQLNETWNHSCGLPIELFQLVYPDDSADVVRDTKYLRESMEFLCSFLEPYPYYPEKYGHAQFSRGGGMEHPTMSFMGSFGFELTLHELAHHWFGNMVTCGSWADIWLNEGFATYLSGMGFERYYPQDWKSWKSKTQQSVWESPEGAVYVKDSLEVSRIFSSRWSYKKAALVLHQLRWWMGDVSFQAGLKSYLSAPELRWGFAKTKDLRQHLETASGMSLEHFFTTWIYGEGFPELDCEWKQQGFRSLEIHLEQSPSIEGGPETYPIPVRISVIGPERDSIVEFRLTGKDSVYVFEFPFPVLRWEPDPEKDMLARWKSIEKIETEAENQVLLFPNPGAEPLLWMPMMEQSVGNYTYQLTDLSGQQLGYSLEAMHGSPIQAPKDLSPGIYLIHMYKDGNPLGVLKWVKPGP